MLQKDTDSITSQDYYLGDQFLIISNCHELAFLEMGRIKSRQKIEPRIMEVLLVLVENEGKVVSKEEIIQKVWGDYGGDESLIQAISKLRKVFKDDAKAPKVIATIPKKGYQLLLPSGAAQVKSAPFKQGKVLPTIIDGPPLQQSYTVLTVGIFTGFIERLTKPRFLLAFIVFSIVLIMVLAILSYTMFWAAVAMNLI